MRTRKTKATRAPKRPVPTPQQLDEIRQEASAEMMLISDALRAAPVIPIYAMCMLDIEKVDLEAETIQVTYESGLGATSDRTEPINEPLARILRAAIGTRVSGPVFRRPDGSRFTRKRLCREWDRACRQAGFVPLQLRDSSLRFCVRGKTHPDNLTISELARKAKVRGPTAARWCEQKAYPNGKKKGRKRRVLGHRSLGGFKGIDGGRGRYNYIRAEGWAIENGNIVPTYNRDQINKVLSSELNDDITPPEEEGFVWVNRATAAHYEWTRDYLRHLANNVVESKRLRPQGQPLEPKRRAANKEQLDAHSQRIKDAEDRRKGHLLPSEFCSAINRPSSTVRSWIADDFCPDLNRPLNLRRDADGRPERQEVFREDGVPTVGRRAGELLFFVASLLGRATGAAEALVLLLISNRRKRFDSCYVIDEAELLYINAVNLVWIYGSTLTKEFGIGATMLLWYARKGRIPGADIKALTCEL
jgi:hypothetical protein